MICADWASNSFGYCLISVHKNSVQTHLFSIGMLLSVIIEKYCWRRGSILSKKLVFCVKIKHISFNTSPAIGELFFNKR